MKVEVQFRTISMDWWASLEHKIKYKKSYKLTPETEAELKECAKVSTELDERMERIHKNVEQAEQ